MDFAALQDIFCTITKAILSIPDTDNKTVRFVNGTDPETGSAPGFKRTQNVVFIDLLPEDEQYNRQREITTRDDGDEKLAIVDHHTDVWRVHFICYGSKGFQRVQKLRGGFSHPEIRQRLQGHHLHHVPNTAAPIRMPELFEGEWWDRHDLNVMFYQSVRDEHSDAVNYIETVPLTATDGETTSSSEVGENTIKRTRKTKKEGE